MLKIINNKSNFVKCNFPKCKGRLLPYVCPSTGYEYQVGEVTIPNTSNLTWKCSYEESHKHLCKHKNKEVSIKGVFSKTEIITCMDCGEVNESKK